MQTVPMPVGRGQWIGSIFRWKYRELPYQFQGYRSRLAGPMTLVTTEEMLLQVHFQDLSTIFWLTRGV